MTVNSFNTQYTMQHSSNNPSSYLQKTITAQMLSVGREGVSGGNKRIFLRISCTKPAYCL